MTVPRRIRVLYLVPDLAVGMPGGGASHVSLYSGTDGAFRWRGTSSSANN